MSYIEKNLIPGERVVYKTGLHWIVLLGPGLAALIFTVSGIALIVHAISSSKADPNSATLFAWLGLALLVLAGVCLVAGHFARSATEMSVTNKRVVIKVGVLTRTTYELLLPKVESISVEESVLGRILGYGTVILRGTGGTPEPFLRVGHPLEFRRQVQQQIETLPTGAAPASQKTSN